MAPTLEFWFDFSCPYAYIASTQVEALAERCGAELDVRPMLLGGVFKARAVPQNLSNVLAPAKREHNRADYHRHARVLEAPLNRPSGHPLRTVDALRCVLAVGQPFLPLAHHFYRAYWVDGIDIGTEEGLRAVLTAAGHDADAVLARARSPEIKQDLHHRTDDAIMRGVFGAPTFFVGDAIYWGQDRMDTVEEALGSTPPPPPRSAPDQLAPVDFYFDYSSPFSYLASERVDAVFGSAARWHPMLLGAVFKAVGQVDVPMFAQNEAKQRHTRADAERHARRYAIPFRWPTRFPMRTVLPLRVTLLAGAHEEPAGRALVQRIYRAYWAEDRDISDPEVVASLCDACGLDGKTLVEGASAPETKLALREATERAVAAGVFGAPTFIVDPDKKPHLYWGSDRLELALRGAMGDERAW